LIRLSRALRKKRPEYKQRHDKVIILHDNDRPHVVKSAKVVKKYLEMLKEIFYRTRRILRTLLLTGCSEGCSKSPVHFFRRNRKLAPKLDRLQKRVIFSRIRKLPERWEKVVGSDGQYFN